MGDEKSNVKSGKSQIKPGFETGGPNKIVCSGSIWIPKVSLGLGRGFLVYLDRVNEKTWSHILQPG